MEGRFNTVLLPKRNKNKGWRMIGLRRLS